MSCSKVSIIMQLRPPLKSNLTVPDDNYRNGLIVDCAEFNRWYSLRCGTSIQLGYWACLKTCVWVCIWLYIPHPIGQPQTTGRARIFSDRAVNRVLIKGQIVALSSAILFQKPSAFTSMRRNSAAKDLGWAVYFGILAEWLASINNRGLYSCMTSVTVTYANVTATQRELKICAMAGGMS